MLIRDAAKIVRLLIVADLDADVDVDVANADAYVDAVVRSVQGEFHDLFIDITWPSCPFHLKHPSGLQKQQWCCEPGRVTVAPLGELGRDPGSTPSGLSP